MKNTAKFLRSKSLMDVINTVTWNCAWRALRSASHIDVTMCVPEYPEMEVPAQMALKFGLGSAVAFIRPSSTKGEWIRLGHVEDITMEFNPEAAR